MGKKNGFRERHVLLSGEAIKNLALINDSLGDGYRAASYDLHIGRIIGPDGEDRSSYELPEQGIVAVVSRETVNIPKNVSAFATVKTSLCNDGILAINIGIVDPLYSNAVSSFLINFGKKPYQLREGQVFLRLAFFRYCQPLNIDPPQRRTTDEYVLDRKRSVLQRFSATFLDLHTTIDSAAKKAFNNYRKNLFIWVPVLALVLTMFSFLLNWANLAVERYHSRNDQTKAELLEQKFEDQMSALAEQNGALRGQLETLTAEITNLKNRTGASQAAPPNRK